MSASAAGFGDLPARFLSAVVLAAIGFTAIWQGGLPLSIFLAVLFGAIVWEQARMHGANTPLIMAALGVIGFLSIEMVSFPIAFVIIVGVGVVGSTLITDRKALFAIAFAITALGAMSFSLISSGSGLAWVFWLVGLVVLTDVAGYFAGKFLGGPKFWPALSPKKTWSGTAAGWLAAAVFGAGMASTLSVGALELAILSALASFASQLGDIFQSFCKRRAGVKDASNLIPGHGGVWDRFDGMLAAALVYWPVVWVV